METKPIFTNKLFTLSQDQRQLVEVTMTEDEHESYEYPVISAESVSGALHQSIVFLNKANNMLEDGEEERQRLRENVYNLKEDVARLEALLAAEKASKNVPRVIEAIKALREATPMGLKNAKDIVNFVLYKSGVRKLEETGSFSEEHLAACVNDALTSWNV